MDFLIDTLWLSLHSDHLSDNTPIAQDLLTDDSTQYPLFKNYTHLLTDNPDLLHNQYLYKSLHKELTNSTFALNPALHTAISDSPTIPYPEYQPERYLHFLQYTYQTIFGYHADELTTYLYKFAAPCHHQGTEWQIPPISHHIYLNKHNHTEEINPLIIKNLLDKTALLNDHHPNTWKHIFWIDCLHCIPKTIKTLSQSGFEIHLVSDYANTLPELSDVNHMKAAGLIGIAVDTLRLSILNVFGGFYSDLNYQLHQDPSPMMKSNTFIIESINLFDDNNISIGNWMIAASPAHTIIHDVLEKSKLLISNFNEYIPSYNYCQTEQITGYLAIVPFDQAIYKFFNTPKQSSHICILTHDLISTPYSYESKRSLGQDAITDVDVMSWL